jgi:HSP20 family protein
MGSFPPIKSFSKRTTSSPLSSCRVLTKNLEIHAKENTVRISGSKTINYPERASMHRRERVSRSFDRTLSVPIQLNPGIKAECRDGILVLFISRAESEKPKSIKIK